jgi:AcrR family transcriptional regulator
MSADAKPAQTEDFALWALPRDRAAGRTFSARQIQVLDGLETIILTEGFRDLTVGGMAERLHCSRRMLYELADSKEALVQLVIDRLLRRLARRAHDATREQHSHLDRFRAFLTQGLTELHRATVSFAEDVAADPGAHDLVASHFRYALSTVEAMLVVGIEAGEFRAIHPRVAANALDAGVARLQQPAVLRTAGVSFAEALEEFLTLFTDGIRARAVDRGRKA